MIKKVKQKPKLEIGMRLADFTNYYWLKDELTEFARGLGLPTHGSKPELSARIERRLRGITFSSKVKARSPRGPRDSDKPLTRETLVINYMSDANTREFFKSAIGPEFHFTYHVNQFRLAAGPGLTYGELVDEWLAERDRRKSPSYKAPIADHGKYNRFIRDFFADEANKGKTLLEAVAAWNAIKNSRGDQKYKPRKA
jgi:hypothetical protein